MVKIHYYKDILFQKVMVFICLEIVWRQGKWHISATISYVKNDKKVWIDVFNSLSKYEIIIGWKSWQ